MSKSEILLEKVPKAPKKRIALGIIVAAAIFGGYFGALRRIIDEKSQRSLELKDEAAIADRVLVTITVIKVDPETRQLTARLRVRPIGTLALDASAPKADLRFVVNNSPGQQVFEFPKGKAVSHIEATLPIEGDLNRYPFDRYETNIWLLMDTPENPKQPIASALPALTATSPSATLTPATIPAPSDLGDVPPDEIVTQGNRSIPLSISVSASTPGMKYTGEVIRNKSIDAIRVHLYLRRPDNLTNASITVMCLMMAIALGVLAMALKAIISRRGKLDVLPLSLSIALIFGLPALRNIQPGVPPVGVLGDYFSFIWAEFFVASAAIVMAFTWVFGSEPKPDSKLEPEPTTYDL